MEASHQLAEAYEQAARRYCVAAGLDPNEQRFLGEWFGAPPQVGLRWREVARCMAELSIMLGAMYQGQPETNDLTVRH